MKNSISIHRIVPNIYSHDLEKSIRFFIDFLKMELVMDMDWILTFASTSNPNAQISILKFNQEGELDNTHTFYLLKYLILTIYMKEQKNIIMK